MATLGTGAQKLIQSQRAATLVEYAILLALIVAICVVGVTQLGGKMSSLFSSTNSGLPMSRTHGERRLREVGGTQKAIRRRMCRKRRRL